MLTTTAHTTTTSASEMEASSTDHYTSQPRRHKRKAASQPENNERLSKRLSLLNLEQNGPKLYVPVENPAAPWPVTQSSGTSSDSRPRPAENDPMQLDDSKYKVYIYNLDDELSSESEPEDGRLVFLPDIEKHLRSTRIPAHILARPDAEAALGKELVLYSIPSSISVPEEKDSVRKAIIEARSRAREKQKADQEVNAQSVNSASDPFEMSVAPPLSSMPDGVVNSSLQTVPAAVTAPASGSDLDEMELD